MTTFLAVWGAILSTVLAIRSIYKDILDRGNIRVEAYLSEWTENDDVTGELLFKYEVEIILTNIGRRPIVVASVGVGRDSSYLALWRRLPSRLRLHRKPPKGYSEATLDVGRGILPKRLDPGESISVKRDNEREKLFFLKSSPEKDAGRPRSRAPRRGLRWPSQAG